MTAAALFQPGIASTAWACETDPDAATVLKARHGVPNHGDITTIDWRKVEPVDVLVAGFPCQDISNAGKRAGIEGDRSGIWANVADAVRVLRPRLVLIENVRALLVRGGVRVVADLAGLGYVGSWRCLRASDVGACHQRDRVFIVATPTDPDREPVRIEPQPVRARLGAPVAGGDREDAVTLLPTPSASDERRGHSTAHGGARSDEIGSLAGIAHLLPTPNATDSRGGPRAVPGARTHDGPDFGPRLRDVAVALLPTPRATDAAKGGPNQRGSAGDLTLPSAVRLLPTPCAGDSKGTRNATAGRTQTRAEGRTNHDGWTLSDIAFADRWAQYGPAIRRWEQVTGRPAPEPTITGKRGGQRLSGAFTEWMMGWPEGWVSGLVDNNAAVRISGNGVVPQQAFAAFVDLTAHLQADA